MKNVNLKLKALRHNPNITEDHISKALEAEDWRVRSSAIQHPKAKTYHITKALNDEDFSFAVLLLNIRMPRRII